VTTYQAKAPFVFNILHTFTASPNPYRTKKAHKAGGTMAGETWMSPMWLKKVFCYQMILTRKRIGMEKLDWIPNGRKNTPV